MRFLIVLMLSLSGCATIFGPQCTGDPTKWSCTCNGSQDPTCAPPLNDWGDNPSVMTKKDGGVDR